MGRLRLRPPPHIPAPVCIKNSIPRHDTHSYMDSLQTALSSPHVRSENRSADISGIAYTFGAWLVCSSIGCTLLGLTAHQTYRYFRLYPGDTKALKIMVIVLLTLDVVHTATNIHICYHYLISNYFRPSVMLSGVWSLRLSLTETGAMVAISHSFFLRRIFLLGGRGIIPVIVIGVLMFSEISFTIAVTVMTFVSVTFAVFREYQCMIWVLLGNAVLVDLLITGCLVWYLRQSRTGFQKTDSVVDVLMVYSINTGLSTSLITFPAMICSIVMPDNMIWSALYVIASKMYSNSLLAVLNSRRSIIDKGMEGLETGSFGMTVVDPPERPRSFALTRRASRYHPSAAIVRPPLEPRSVNPWNAKETDVTSDIVIDIVREQSSPRSD
ncbi:hypothetical protein BD413DRAFT_270727 [Trametes elegans]|nr:hypothetical protein BD413DRAFT_270727 [Trametes elegans]